MSQITFRSRIPGGEGPHAGHDVEVLTGWDRPLQMHFLVVTDKTNEDKAILATDDRSTHLVDWEQLDRDFPETVYSNLADPSLPFPGKMTAFQVLEVLDRLGIPYPDDLGAVLDEHRDRDAGNEHVQLDPTTT